VLAHFGGELLPGLGGRRAQVKGEKQKSCVLKNKSQRAPERYVKFLQTTPAGLVPQQQQCRPPSTKIDHGAERAMLFDAGQSNA
jgi:hypothetical protein